MKLSSCLPIAASAIFLVGMSDPEASMPDIYLLAGQSNMSGRGALEDLAPAERAPDPRVRLFGNDDIYRDAIEPLDTAEGQVDAVSADVRPQVGPGLFFARRMLRLDGRAILLVPCAKGASAIGQWAPGGGRDTLYGSCLRRARAVGAGHVAGILWYQGEADAVSSDRAKAWPQAFHGLVASFRADLDNEHLPVVVVGLGDKARAPDKGARWPGWEQMQQMQATLALPCVATVSAQGLPQNPDELHLSTAAQRRLGEQLAVAMGKLRQECR